MGQWSPISVSVELLHQTRLPGAGTSLPCPGRGQEWETALCALITQINAWSRPGTSTYTSLCLLTTTLLLLTQLIGAQGHIGHDWQPIPGSSR